MPNLSIAEENYIKAIYHLQGADKAVGTNDLADRLRTTAASATDMIKKLKNKKLINHRAYYGCHLLSDGKKAALSIIRRHRLWEYFLSKELGFNWDEVHELAEELEHIRDTRLVNRLDQYLGYPRFDPHGDPIPDEKGNLPEEDQCSLNQLPIHQSAVVRRISEQSDISRELLEANNIRIGAGIKIVKKFSFDESLEIRIDNKRLTQISNQLAKIIYVIPNE